MSKNELEQFNYSILESQPGRILLEGKRYILFNADAHGTLRRDLIENLGMERSKGFLLRYGWECGVHDAKDQKSKFPNISDHELIKKGAQLHKFQGAVDVHIVEFEMDLANNQYYLESYWGDSYEVEQHLKYFGKSNEPICWTLLGYAGGYATELLGKEIYYKEVSCRARGDDRCFSIGKTLEEWGDEFKSEQLHYYNETKIAEELDVAYKRIQRQNELLSKTTSLHEQLNQMVLSGKGLDFIIEKVGKLLNYPIIVENVNLRSLGWWLPQHSKNSIQDCTLSTYLNQSSELRLILKRIEKEKRPLDWSRSENSSHTIIPILIGDELEGYLSVVHPNNSESDFVRMVAGRAAGVIALDFSREKIKLETENRLKGEFIDELLNSSKPVEEIKKRALFMGYDFNKKHQLMIWEIDPSVKDQLQQEKFLDLRKKIYNIINSALSSINKKSLVIERKQEILSIIFPNDKWQITKIVDEVNSLLQKSFNKLAVSICISRFSYSIEELRNVYSEAQNTLQLLTNSGRIGETFYVDDLKSFDLLYAGSANDQLLSFSKNMLNDLMIYDKENDAELTWTLFIFLSNDCQLQTTAQLLNLSVSGLKYRIQRIKDIGDINWDNTEERFNLLLSLKVLRTNGLLKPL